MQNYFTFVLASIGLNDSSATDQTFSDEEELQYYNKTSKQLLRTKELAFKPLDDLMEQISLTNAFARFVEEKEKEIKYTFPHNVDWYDKFTEESQPYYLKWEEKLAAEKTFSFLYKRSRRLPKQPYRGSASIFQKCINPLLYDAYTLSEATSY